MRKLILLDIVLVLVPATILAVGGLFLSYFIVLDSLVKTVKLYEFLVLSLLVMCTLAIVSLWLFLVELYNTREYLTKKTKSYCKFFALLGGIIAIWASVSVLINSIFGFGSPEVFQVGGLFSPGIPMLIPLIHYCYLFRKYYSNRGH